MWESAVRELVSQAAEPLTITRPQETIIDMVTGSGAVVQLVLLLLLALLGRELGDHLHQASAGAAGRARVRSVSSTSSGTRRT